MTSKPLISSAMAGAFALPLLLLLLSVLLPSRASAQAPGGTVTALTGDVQVVRGTNTSAATMGMQVLVGDQFKTGLGANVTVTLSDGSKFELGESGEATLDQHTVDAAGVATTKIGLFKGIVRSFVTRTLGAPPGNYEVHTPNAIAAARGTEYDTGHHEGVARSAFPGCTEFTDVGVFKGTVGLSNPANLGPGPVDVHEGYRSTVPCALLPTVPVLIGAATAGSLLSGTTAAAAGGVAGVGGIVGGLAAGGTFSGGSPTGHTASSSQ
jgi:FecR protein